MKLILTVTVLLTAGLHASELTDKSGRAVEGEVVRVIPAQVEIKLPSGTRMMPLGNLSLESQAQVTGEKPLEELLAEERGIRQNTEEIVELQKVLIAELKAQLPEKTGKVKIEDFGASVINSSDRYVSYGWKVEIFNGTERDISLTVIFEGVDKNKIPLSTNTEYNQAIRSGERRTITGQRMVEAEAYRRIETWIARTEAGR